MKKTKWFDVALLFLVVVSIINFYLSASFAVFRGRIVEDGFREGMKWGWFIFNVLSSRERNCVARVEVRNTGQNFLWTEDFQFNVTKGMNEIKVEVPLPDGKNRVTGDVKCS